MRLITFLFVCPLFLLSFGVKAQDAMENLVQINGVTMSSDSLRAIPNVTVLVRHKHRGVESSSRGVFSIIAAKGDTLEFHCLGFRERHVVIPENIPGQYFSMIQLMVQDTFYLPETIIRPFPSREEFNYAFKYWDIPDDQYELARKNTNELILRALAYSLPRDGRESQAVYQQGLSNQAIYYGQQQPMKLFSPQAWAEFYEAWKRGDYRRRH